MGLREKIDSDIKEAMKSGAKDKVSALRMLSAAIKNKMIEKRPAELTDGDVQDTVRSLIKQRRDSIEQFTKGGRQDLADKEIGEVKFLEVYLPQQLPREDVERIVREAIAQTGAQGVKDMGKVMKAVQAVIAGRADNKLVSELVKSSLG
jgi:uncharacterized protein YqeY